MRCSQAAASTGAKAVIRTLHPAAFWRPGDFLLPGTMVPHAFYRKHDSHFKPPGRGRTADLSRPAFQKNFALFVVPFMFPRPGPCCRGRGPGGRETGGVRYRVLRIATGAVRPRNDNSQEVWRGRTGSSAPTDAFRKCVGEGLCPSRGRGRTPPLRRTEKKCVIASAFT